MKEAEAYELAKHVLNVEANKSVFVTDNGTIYINSNAEAIKKHCSKVIHLKIDGIIQPLKKTK
jgi:hypothetical protein